MKTCRVCGVEKLSTDFCIWKTICKQCNRDRQNYYRTRTKEQWESDTAQRVEKRRLQYLDAENRRTEKLFCECGGSYIMCDVSRKNRHELSKKHQQFVELKDRIDNNRYIKLHIMMRKTIIRKVIFG